MPTLEEEIGFKPAPTAHSLEESIGFEPASKLESEIGFEAGGSLEGFMRQAPTSSEVPTPLQAASAPVLPASNKIEPLGTVPPLSADEIEQTLMTPAVEVPPSARRYIAKTLAAAVPFLGATGKSEPIAQGVANTLAGTAETATSPASPLIVGAQAVPVLRETVDAAFAASLIKSAAQKVGEASVTGDVQQMAEAGSEAALAGLAARGAAMRHAADTLQPEEVLSDATRAFEATTGEKPVAPVEAQTQTAAREAAPAVATAAEREANASSQQSAAALHGDVLRSGQEGTPAREMPEDAGQPVEGLRRNQGERVASAPPAEALAPPTAASNTPPPESEVTQAGGTGLVEDPIARAVAFEPGEPSHGDLGAVPSSVRALNAIGEQLEHLRDGFTALARSAANKDEITRARDAADTLANTEGRQVFNSLRLEAPSRADREAAYAIIEANGDKARLAQFAAQATGKDAHAARAARLADSDYARLLPLADKTSQILDAQLALENARGINTLERDAYVPHIIDTDLLMGKGRPVVIAGSAGGGLLSGFKKGRTFDTIYDAIEAGYKPRSMDVAEVAEHRVRAGQSLINRKTWVDSMRSIVDPTDHQPLVVDVERRERGPGLPPFETAPMGYQVREALPGVRIAIHEGYTRLFDTLTATSSLGNSLVGKAILNAEGALKHGLLLFDTFHASRIAQKELFLTRGAGGYRRGLSLLEYSDADLAKARAAGEITPEIALYARANRPTADLLMRSGLNVGRIEEALYAQAARHIPIVGTFNKWVFDKLTRGAMLESGLIEFERVKAANPAMSDAQVAGQVASKLNALFGNLGRQGLFKNATYRDIARIVALAPQWVEGMARTEAGAAKELVAGILTRGNPIAGTLARSVGQGLLAYVIGTQLLNLATRGHPTWQNSEKGHKLDAWIPDVTGRTPGYFLSPLSVVAELSHDFLRYLHDEGSPLKAAVRIARNKLSPLGRAVDTLVERKDYKGAPLGSDWDVLKAAGVSLAPTPIPLSPLARTDNAGQVQRQLTASLGVKTENAPPADSQIRDLAREWARSSPDAKVRNAEERKEREGYTAGDYTALRKALRTGDSETAQAEFTQLLQSHSMKQINAAMEPTHPVTGTRRMEGVFRQSLDEVGRKLYEQALAERRVMQQRYFALRAKVAAQKEAK